MCPILLYNLKVRLIALYFQFQNQWHNLKYYTWVEQQGKTVEELDAQKDPQWWINHQQLIPEMDERIKERRKSGF